MKNIDTQSTGKEFKTEGITYNLPGAKFHGRRDDGVFLYIYFNGMAAADLAGSTLKEYQRERARLIEIGHVVLDQ